MCSSVSDTEIKKYMFRDAFKSIVGTDLWDTHRILIDRYKKMYSSTELLRNGGVVDIEKLQDMITSIKFMRLSFDKKVSSLLDTSEGKYEDRKIRHARLYLNGLLRLIETCENSASISIGMSNTS